MDRSVSRAIVLKAVLEFLQKERGVGHTVLFEGVPEEYRGAFTRVNATADVLKRGLQPWLKTAAPHLDALRAIDDPLLPILIRYASDGELPAAYQAQAADTAPPEFPIGEWRQPLLKDQIIRELSGTWRVFRLSAQRVSDSADSEPMVDHCLLTIRPKSYYAANPSAWTHFSMWQKEEQEDFSCKVVRTDGVCMHHHNLYLTGLLDRIRANIPCSVMLKHQLGGRRNAEHAEQLFGIAFMTNSKGQHTAAHVDAIYEPGSAGWSEADFRARRSALLKQLGSRPLQEFSDHGKVRYKELRELSKRVVFQ